MKTIPDKKAGQTKRTYSIRLYWHSFTQHEVKASSEEEAITLARNECTDEQILNNLVEEDAPDVQLAMDGTETTGENCP